MEEMFGSGPGGIQMSTANYDATLIGWNTDSSGVDGDGIDDIPQNIVFGGGKNTYCTSEVERQNLIDTHGWTVNDNGLDCPAVKFEVKVYLQGASLNASGGSLNLMRDDLRANGFLPSISPYDGITSCDPSIFTNDDEEGIIDWILVELRDAADNTNVVFSGSYLLTRQGLITSTTEGVPEADVPAGNYYITIKHRNHLGIMSASPIALNSDTVTTVDFSDGSTPTFGVRCTDHTLGMPAGVLGMWAGDTNGDGKINIIGATNDSNAIRDKILNDPINQIIQFYGFSVSGYTNEDVNLTGGANIIGAVNDANVLRDNVLNHPVNLILQFYGYNMSWNSYLAMVPSVRMSFDTEMVQRNNQTLNND